jgi:F-type H+-transporting ATPase subunit delta
MAAIDLRYARALDSVVVEHRLDRALVQQQLASLEATLDASADLREVLEDPSIPEQQKLRLLDALASKLSLDKIVRNFIALIASHHRLHEFAGISKAYSALADEAGSVTEVEVVSASPLSDASKSQLVAQVAKLVGSEQIHPIYTQDQSLLGGAILRIGSTVYDGSVRSQLQHLKQSLIASLA